MRLDLEEAADMLNKDIFIVNAVMNLRHEICAFFCGHPIKAQREGVALSQSIHGLSVPEPADVLLTIHEIGAGHTQGPLSTSSAMSGTSVRIEPRRVEQPIRGGETP